jgi:hypothetical protein
METKVPVLLIVLVETARLRWFVAGIQLDGTPLPLMCSEEGDLEHYLGLQFDEQVSFLRHRFSGVLQRGCDRLWARQQKPCQIVFLFDDLLEQDNGQLTQRVAEHFVQWMTRPPVVAFKSESKFDAGDSQSLCKLVGEMDPSLSNPLQTCLPSLLAAINDPAAWELSPKKVKT